MRDKVKRFISILMTALMLVNLMPVGALADGITSGGYQQQVAESTGYYTVYVYAKINGTLPEGSTADVNADQWYTLGKISNVYMLNPKNYEFDTLLGYEVGGVSAWSILSNMTPYPKNNNYKKIPWQKAERGVGGNDDFGFKVCSGATDYPSAGTGKTWHLNLLVDITKITPKYNIIYKDIASGDVLITNEVFGKFQSRRNYTADSNFNHNGRKYKCVDQRPTRQLVDKVKEEVFYYKDVGPVQYNLTIDYRYENENGKRVEEDKLNPYYKNPYTQTLDHGTEYSVASPVIPGYTADESVVTGTLTEDTTVTVVYRKRNDLSYTVNYYWNGTTEKVATSKTFDGQTFGKTVEASPATIEGYTITPESNKKKSITITEGTNEINFYYYKNVELTGKSKTETYDGQEQSVSGFTGAPEDADFSDITVGAKGTNVGEYPAEFADGTVDTVDATGKYIVTKAINGTLKITPVETEVVVKIAGNTKTETYNGKEHNVEGYTVTSISNPLYTANDFTFSGTAEAKGTDAGTYPMGLTADQFTNNKSKNFSKVTFEVADGWLKINPIDKVTVTITGRTLETTYDGKEHDVFGYDATPSNALYRPNEDIQFNGTDYNKIAKGTDAGTYPMGLEVSYFTNISDNFTNVEFIVTDGYVKINPRPVMLTSANLIKVYDGTPLTNGDAPVKEEFGTEKAFPEGEGVTYAFTGGQTNAGSSKNMFTYAWNEGTNKDNYTIYQIEGDLVVTPIDGIKVTITGHKDTQTYDGKPHKVEGYDVKPDNPLFTEKDIEFNGEAEATGTDVRIDPYQMGLKPEQFTNTSNNFTNVEFVVEDGQIVITPRAVTLTSETAGKTYDGTALEKPVVTVGGDGFVEGQVTEIKATGSVTNAGSVANTITFTPNKETFKDGNYAITKTEGTLTIAKRSVLITSQSATKTYDGSALTRPAVTITGDGFVPGELAKAEATGSITKVGSTPNAIRYTTTGAFNAANYSIALSVGTLTVTEKPKPEPRRTFNLTISYVYQNGKRAAASYNRGGLKNGETFDITSPVIAGYTASETVVSGTIYNRDIKVTVIYTADGVNLDDYGVPLGLGNITMNVGDCFE